MLSVTLNNGFKAEISEDARDDFEIFEALAELDEENPQYSKLIFVYKRLLGEEQYKALREFMRSEDGRISTVGMFTVLQEILENSGDEVKNS